MRITGIIVMYLYLASHMSCTQSGQLGTSNDLHESKKLGVFICEYVSPVNPYFVNDTFKITVKEAWLERKWRFSSSMSGEITPFNEYQLRVNTDEDDLKGFPMNWSIGNSTEFYLRRCGKNGMIGDFKTMPSDSLVYSVQKGELFVNKNPETLGIFILIKSKI